MKTIGKFKALAGALLAPAMVAGGVALYAVNNSEVQQNAQLEQPVAITAPAQQTEATAAFSESASAPNNEAQAAEASVINADQQTARTINAEEQTANAENSAPSEESAQTGLPIIDNILNSFNSLLNTQNEQNEDYFTIEITSNDESFGNVYATEEGSGDPISSINVLSGTIIQKNSNSLTYTNEKNEQNTIYAVAKPDELSRYYFDTWYDVPNEAITEQPSSAITA